MVLIVTSRINSTLLVVDVLCLFMAIEINKAALTRAALPNTKLSLPNRLRNDWQTLVAGFIH